ncbi:MAG TPA: hypothetical protein VI408_00430 [Gaiellaceae bacterium]
MRALVATGAVLALALAAPASGNAPQRPAVPVAVQTTSYPWVQPPAGVGVAAIRPAEVAPLTCSSVQPPCWIFER